MLRDMTGFAASGAVGFSAARVELDDEAKPKVSWGARDFWKIVEKPTSPFKVPGFYTLSE
jgi:hypothetical protein